VSEGIDKQIANSILSKSLVLGSKETLEAIKSGRAKAVIISSSCPSNLREEIKYHASLEKIPLHILKRTSVDIGRICHKPFKVSALALLISSKKEKKTKKQLSKGLPSSK